MYSVIFLDIDGVLNSGKYIDSLTDFADLHDSMQLDPQAIKRLNQITDATGAVFVISSTWRMNYKLISDLRSVFNKAGITGKVLGFTPINGKSRGEQIKEYLDQNSSRVKSFIILDDDSDMGELTSYLIKTHFSDGLQDSHVEKAISAFSNEEVPIQ